MLTNKYRMIVSSLRLCGLLMLTANAYAQPQSSQLPPPPPMQGDQPSMQDGQPPMMGGHPSMGAEQPGFEGQRGEDGDDLRINWSELDLTPEQREQMRLKRRDFQVSTASVRAELNFAEQDLRAEMLKDEVDQAKVDSLVQQVSTLKQKISAAAIDNLLAIKALLTPEQVARLATMQSPLPPELRSVDLTPEQQTQIRQAFETSRQQMKATAEELQTLRQELRATLFAPETDTAKLKELQAAIAAKELAFNKERTNLLLQIKGLLTPEQRKQMQQGRQQQQKKVKLPGKKK
jgi:Spy/CpxP family protein refolding chaperone